MSEHTQGPWEAYDGHGHKLGHWAILTGKHTVVCSTPSDGPDDKAAAHLIAAAPELLEVLGVLLRQYRRVRPQIAGTDTYEEWARAAIAKAVK